MTPYRLIRKQWLIASVLVGLLVKVVTPAAFAFKLVPITMLFEPSGRGANQAFRVENDSDRLTAVQVSILSREMSLDGQEKNSPSEDDFIVYPPQIILRPKQSQTVRVKWIGEANPKKELAYRILAEELPVNLNKEPTSGSKINLIVRYLGSIYIVPKGAKPELVVDSAQVTIESGQRKLQLVLHNQGTAHFIPRQLKLTLESGAKILTLDTEQLQGVIGENILAGTKRRFVLQAPEGLPEGSLNATLDYRQARH